MADANLMPLVVDASVAFKWFVPEASSESALEYLSSDELLWAPDLLLTEIANALYVRLRSIEGGFPAAEAAVARLPSLYSSLLPTRDYVPAALRLSFELRHAIYDCTYLAVCEAHDLRFVTADKEFAGKLRGTRYGPRVELLA